MTNLYDILLRKYQKDLLGSIENMKFFKRIFIKDTSVRVQVYPKQEYNDPFEQKIVEDKDHIKSSEERLADAFPTNTKQYVHDNDTGQIVATDISPPIMSDGAKVPESVLPAHERVVKPEGNEPIYKEVRIDEEAKES